MHKVILGPVCCCLLALSACSKHDDNVVQGYFEGDYLYVASSQEGNLVELSVHRGQSVKTGDPIFVLDSEPESDEVMQAQSVLQQSKATLADIKLGKRPDEIKEIEADIAATDAAINFYAKQVARYDHLAQKDYASEEDYDDNKYKHDMAVAKKANYEASLALAKLGDRENQIKAQEQVVAQNEASLKQMLWQESQNKQSSPISGIIFDTYYLPGEWVPAGSPVTSILSPQNIKVIFFVSETQLAHVQVGDSVTVHCDQCDHVTAEISYISDEYEYTPPVIFSEDMRDKLVYEVKAVMPAQTALNYHPGQPVDVVLPGAAE